MGYPLVTITEEQKPNKTRVLKLTQTTFYC